MIIYFIFKMQGSFAQKNIFEACDWLVSWTFIELHDIFAIATLSKVTEQFQSYGFLAYIAECGGFVGKIVSVIFNI